MTVVVYLLVMKNVSWGSGRGGTISPPPPAPCTVIGWKDGPCVGSTPCSTSGTQTQTARFYSATASCPAQTQTVACNNAPGCKPPQSAWTWNPSSATSVTTVWMSATPWQASLWPTYKGPLALKSYDGTWCLTFLTATGQLCMWKKSGSTYTPQWWTQPGSATSLPSFGADGSISCPGLTWKWAPTSSKNGPFTLMIGGAGSIDVRDATNTIVSMTPAWPTSGAY